MAPGSSPPWPGSSAIDDEPLRGRWRAGRVRRWRCQMGWWTLWPGGTVAALLRVAGAVAAPRLLAGRCLRRLACVGGGALAVWPGLRCGSAGRRRSPPRPDRSRAGCGRWIERSQRVGLLLGVEVQRQAVLVGGDRAQCERLAARMACLRSITKRTRAGGDWPTRMPAMLGSSARTLATSSLQRRVQRPMPSMSTASRGGVGHKRWIWQC